MKKGNFVLMFIPFIHSFIHLIYIITNNYKFLIINNRAAAPADTDSDRDDANNSRSTPLSIIPHQMRGFLANFSNMLIVGQAYDCCTACSDKVINEYKT